MIHSRICAFLTLTLCLFSVYSFASGNFDDVQKSMLSVITYDEKGNMLHTGNAFYISANGEALSDYDLFKGASKATVIDHKGKKGEVTRICGANDTYNVLRFRTNQTHTPALEQAGQVGTKGMMVCIVSPSKSQKKANEKTATITEATTSDNHTYYTLNRLPDERLVSYPVVTADGKVIAIVQQNKIKNSKETYALSSEISSTLVASPLMFTSSALKAISIPKALPSDEEQASTVLFLASNASDSLEFLQAVDDFNTLFPTSATGIMERAKYYANKKQYAKSDADLTQALALSKEKDEVHYTFSQIIYNKNLTDSSTSYKDWTLERALQEAENAYQEKPENLYLLQQGKCLFALKEYQKAYEVYSRINKGSFASAQTFLYAAKAKELAGGTNQEIIVLLDSAIAKFGTPYTPEAAPYFFERATKHYATGNYKLSVLDFNEYEHIMGYKNLKANFYYIRYQAELGANMFQQALDDLTHATTLDEKEPLYLSELALLQVNLGLFDEAYVSAQKVVKIAPESSTGYLALGIIYGERKNKAEATRNLQKAKALGDEQADYFLKKYAQ